MDSENQYFGDTAAVDPSSALTSTVHDSPERV